MPGPRLAKALPGKKLDTAYKVVRFFLFIFLFLVIYYVFCVKRKPPVIFMFNTRCLDLKYILTTLTLGFVQSVVKLVQ